MKKTIILLINVLWISLNTYAQKNNIKSSELPRVLINNNISTHFISPEPIQYVDISTNAVVGDLPVQNVVRLKPILDSLQRQFGRSLNQSQQNLGIVTIVGQKYMAQYHLIYTNNNDAETNIQILPQHTQPLDHHENSLSDTELKQFALQATKRRASYYAVKANAYGIKAQLNNVYSVGDYFFIDIAYKNQTHIKYDIDQIRFKIEDKKVTKASNVQSIEIEPVFKLYNAKSFKRKYRNVFVFRKFTYPGNKVLTIEMGEKQISGRIINLQLDYSDILNADIL